MKKDNHVDPELFDLFLTSGAYRDYAEQFLRPDQIDAVDISQYITSKQAAESVTLITARRATPARQ